MKKSAAFFTLGCKVNYYETEAMKDLFEREGYYIKDFKEAADVYVVNTCTVTGLSDRKSRQLIRQARKRSPEAIIVVTGCYAQVAPEELQKLPEVNIITGTHKRHDLPRMVEEAGRNAVLNLVRPFGDSAVFERLSYRANRSRTRAFLKVQEGCEQNCRYCVVPLARGPVRSAPLKDIISEVEEIAASGYRELVLTGIRLGMYEDESEDCTLGGLIREIEKNTSIERIRLSSLEPTDFTGELIETIASSEKVCRHLHIPLQSGSDYILRKMNRPYNTGEYSFIIGRLRELMPGIALGSDIIVGFPGEKEEHHRQSLKYIENISFSRLHIFRFSPRPRTEAFKMTGQVEPPVKETRWREVDELGKKTASDYRRSFINKREKVLIERAESKEGYIEGLTPHYIKARAKAGDTPTQWVGRVVLMEMKDETGDFLNGVFLSEA